MKTAIKKAHPHQQDWRTIPQDTRRKWYHTESDHMLWTVIAEKVHPKYENSATRYGVTKNGIVIWCEDKVSAYLLLEELRVATGEGRA